MTTLVLPHWSATRFMLFDQCPGEFKARYVDGVALEPTEALCFGKAVHLGLETHFNGGDGERAFRAAWKVETEVLGGIVNRGLTSMGLTLIEKVIDLGLQGIPEYGFSLDTNGDLGAPIVGAIDLWDARNNTVFDFKTTRGNWSQERAQSEVWQPLLYTYAMWDQEGTWPAFEYIVLNRITGQLSRFRREWTPDEWLAQMNDAYLRMVAIADRAQRGQLDCLDNHGYCPECGDRWSHTHECDETTHSRRIRL